MGDWCISRKRYWGLPLPFYRCEDCNELTVVRSHRATRARAIDPEAVDALPELHKPWIDDIKIRCRNCSARATRVVEVGDCWLDAGITPFSTLGYFDDHATWATRFPVTWVCEIREQVRLWFYSMLFMSVVLEGRTPYKRVLSHERVISDTGEKFSKTGKMIRFDDAVAEIGADPIRYLFNRQPVRGRMPVRLRDRRAGPTSHRRTVEHRVILRHVREHRPGRDRRADDPRRPAPHLRPVALARHRPARGRRHRCDGRGRHAGDAARGRSVRRRSLELVRAPQSAPVLARGRTMPTSRHATRCSSSVAVRRSSCWHRRSRSSPRNCGNTSCGRSTGMPKRRCTTHSGRPCPRHGPTTALLERTKVVRATISTALRLREEAKLRVRQPLPAVHLAAEDEQTRAALRRAGRSDRGGAQREARRARPATSPTLEEDHLALDFRRAGPVLRKQLDAVSIQIAELVRRGTRRRDRRDP